MTPSLKKRFWKDVSVSAEADKGFAIHLDARPLRTPAKAGLIVPVRPLAEAIRDEWAAQEGEVDPEAMPFTKLANAAIDNMALQADGVVAMLTEYGGTDLTCYRAESPAALAERQAAAWDPLLDWLAETHGARLVTTTGVLPVAQPDKAMAVLAAWLSDRDHFSLMALHDLVCLSGSLVVAMAVAEGQRDARAAWALSRVDELWQAEQWGEDAEAAEAAAVKEADFIRAAQLFDWINGVR